ncbi:MAG: RNA pseudouridine synthase [Robiginitomaculum sp.]|nr:MAG: RNA pseudouridine synthase [Robiginitomaculum sp.]
MTNDPQTAATITSIEVPEDQAPGRLDKFLASALDDLSRSRLKVLIEEGRLSLNGTVITDPSAKLRPGERYLLDLPAPRAASPEAEDIPLNILYEDEHLIVLEKEIGMTVHPAVGNWSGTLVNALLHHCAGELSGIGGVERPGIVHRIDKDTSGIMVVAKTDRAHQGLSKQFAAHSVERAYLALVRGGPKPKEGRIETRLARSQHDRKKQAVVRDPRSEHGRHAITNYKVLHSYGREAGQPVGSPMASMVECRLLTGRTHQIRVHMAHIGCPLLGDPVYGKTRTFRKITNKDGESLKDFSRQALHATILGFTHPLTKETLRFETKPPADMQRLIRFLEGL